MHRNLVFEDLEFLIAWPEDTKGYQQEKKLIEDLIEMCNEHGYGFVPQVTKTIEAIWRNMDPDEIQSMKDAAAERRKSIREYAKNGKK